MKPLCTYVQVQKEAARREYHNLRYDQPYQTALYHASVLLQYSRWHFTEYEAELESLTSQDVEVNRSPVAGQDS